MCWILLDLTLCPRVLRESHKELRRAACTRGRTEMDSHWSRLREAMVMRSPGGGCSLLRLCSEMEAGHGEQRGAV